MGLFYRISAENMKLFPAAAMDFPKFRRAFLWAENNKDVIWYMHYL